MKYIITLILLFTTILKAQSQTTIEEYNYITRGYKDQLEKGLDMKKGYLFSEISTIQTNERTATLKALNRIDSKGAKIIAAYMIIYKKVDAESEYICIPHPNSEEKIRNVFYLNLASNETNFLKNAIIAELISRSLKW